MRSPCPAASDSGHEVRAPRLRPLGLLTNPRGRSKADHCRQWVKDLVAAGVRVFVPEIAGYEVRRKLIHIRATAGIRRLNQVKATLDYAPLTTDVMLLAADLWATARRAGLPTAPPEALDGDCILAAEALIAAGPTDTVTVATDNVAHLSRFVDARLWETITA
jgi:predicted nucleic acid-binding protein